MIGAGAVSSCTENDTTAPDLGFLQIDPRTAEVLIPFADFVDDVQVFGGYGAAQDLGYGAVTLDLDGMTARALAHLNDLPTVAEVTASTRFSGGRVVLIFDTVSGPSDSLVDVELYEVSEDWHPPTVTWEVAVDTAGERRSWTQPGGGLTTVLGGATFNAFRDRQTNSAAALVDTVSIPIDSATVAALGETGAVKGFLVSAVQPGVLLRMVGVRLQIFAVLATTPETIMEVGVPAVDLTFMTDPAPTAPMGWLRVGGVPSWRSIITMSIPPTVDGPAEFCGSVGCQVDLTQVHVNLAELVLTTRQTESGFQPQDTTRMEIRSVLNTELLPKSPVGGPLGPFVESLSPELFSVQAGTEASLSLTSFVAGLLSEAAETGTVSVATVALLSAIEPFTIGFASFEGGGGAGAPALRLLYTAANGVGLP